MQVEAIYDEGRLAFISPVKLRQERIRLVVEIPDDAIDKTPVKNKLSYQLPPEALALALAMEERLDQVRTAPWPDDENLSPLTQKKLARIKVFDLRDEIRNLR